MAIRVDTAAKHLCEAREWSLSNLSLQKLLYLSQVEYAAANDGAPLLDAGFEAWDYGPVIPALYGRLKMFGADPVGDVFYDALRLREPSGSKAAIDAALANFGDASPGELIELTHWNKGAWSRYYEPGLRGTPIPQSDIAREARDRQTYRREWDSIAACESAAEG